MDDIEGAVPTAEARDSPAESLPPDASRAHVTKPKLVNVEAGRGVAALLVVLYHVDRYYFTADKYWHAAALGGLFKFGHAGVQFFFVLSGYIMMTVHRADIGRPSKVASFLKKRFYRIYPFFWTVMAVTVALFFLFPTTGRPEYRNPSILLQSFFLVGQDPFTAPVFVSWTLWHEILFYSIFALVIAAPRLGLAVFAAWVAGCLWQPFFFPDPPWPIYLTGFINILFGMGIAAAVALEQWRIPWARAVIVLGAATYFGVGLANDLAANIPVALSDTLYGLGSAMMLLGGVEAERCGKLRAPRWLVALGAASFSIYLTHMLTLPIAAKAASRLGFTHSIPPWIAFFGLAAAALAAGVVIHHALEVRIIALSRRIASAIATRLARRTGAPSAVVARSTDEA